MMNAFHALLRELIGPKALAILSKEYEEHCNWQHAVGLVLILAIVYLIRDYVADARVPSITVDVNDEEGKCKADVQLDSFTAFRRCR